MSDDCKGGSPSSSRATMENKDKTKFSDKERIRLEEEGLCEDDFKRIPVDPLEEVECPELLKSQGESCWDSKQLVTLADLGNWTADLSPERTETSNNTPEDKPTTSLKQKIKRPMKRKKKKTGETSGAKVAKCSE